MADDLEARLVLGDELLRKGDPQGELIVVQCELERGGFDRRRGVELRKRELELLPEARARLEGTPLHDKGVEFRRGAVDKITIDVAAYVRDEDAIWKLAPDLRHVDLHGLQQESTRDTPEGDDWLHVREPLALALKSGRITSLGLLDAEVRWQLGTTTYGGTFELEEMTDSVTGHVAQWLVETKMMPRFRGLHLGSTHAAVLKMLATEPSAAHLDDLQMYDQPYDESMFGDLAATKLAPRRIHLDHYTAPIPDRRFSDSSFLSRATELRVPGLADFTFGRRLRRLMLRGSYEPGWIECITNEPALSGLEELVLADPHKQGTLDLRPLEDPKHLESLRILRLRCTVPVEEARLFLRSPLARRLEVFEHYNYNYERVPSLDVNEWDGHLLPWPRKSKK